MVSRIERATVLNFTRNTARNVKNLGWLIAHKHEVTDLSFVTAPNGRTLKRQGYFTPGNPETEYDFSGHLWAYLTLDNGDRVLYITPYASLLVCRLFCDRPSWSHLTLRRV